MFRVLFELVDDSKYRNSTRKMLDQEFNGYGYMKRVYGIEHMPDLATVVKLSITDTLTKAYSRIVFDSFVTEEIKQSIRYHAPLTFIIFSIDGFKAINKEYGHLVGDQVLKELADVVRKYIRTSDMLFRWFADEFLIVTPHTDVNGAKKMVESLAETISTHDFRTVGRLTCTFALLQFDGKNSDTKEIVLQLEDRLEEHRSMRA